MNENGEKRTVDKAMLDKQHNIQLPNKCFSKKKKDFSVQASALLFNKKFGNTNKTGKTSLNNLFNLLEKWGYNEKSHTEDFNKIEI